jgi:hypothetical protein
MQVRHNNWAGQGWISCLHGNAALQLGMGPNQRLHRTAGRGVGQRQGQGPGGVVLDDQSDQLVKMLTLCRTLAIRRAHWRLISICWCLQHHMQIVKTGYTACQIRNGGDYDYGSGRHRKLMDPHQCQKSSVSKTADLGSPRQLCWKSAA